MKKLRKWLIRLTIALLIGITTIICTECWVTFHTSEKVTQDSNQLANYKVGLLLGTGKYLNSGYVNLYYSYRIQAAADLFKKGKIKYILVSGDNSREDYDEPTTIKEDLMKKGVPENRIYLDYAGFRTLDSIVRAKEVFGQKELIIISQKFHVERAICIAEAKNIQAMGYIAKDVSTRYGFKTIVRERLARVKMVFDLIIGIQPKFLGKKIQIG